MSVRRYVSVSTGWVVVCKRFAWSGFKGGFFGLGRGRDAYREILVRAFCGLSQIAELGLNLSGS